MWYEQSLRCGNKGKHLHKGKITGKGFSQERIISGFIPEIISVPHAKNHRTKRKETIY